MFATFIGTSLRHGGNERIITGVTWAQSVGVHLPLKGVFPLISPTRGAAPSADSRLKFITGVSAASV